MPSSLGAEAQAMSLALGFVAWATLFFLQELIHGSFDLRGAPAGNTRETCSLCYRLQDSVRSFACSWEPNKVARQEVCRRVFKENGVCDTLGTYWFAIGRWAHEGQGRGS